ncbi:MAG: pilus assembly protein PilM [Candidatus Hydrogenedentota bacterium]
MISLGKRKQPVLGIDIGNNYLKVAIVEAKKSGFKLSRALSLPLPSDDTIKPEERKTLIVNTLKQLLKENKIKEKRAVVSIPGQFMLFRTLQLPATAMEKLDQMVQYEAEQVIPFPINEVIYDYKVVQKKKEASEETEQPDEKKQQELIEIALVAVKRDKIDEYLDILDECRLKPIGVDITPFSVANSLLIKYPQKKDEVFVIIDIGAGATDITIVNKGIIDFTRATSIAGNALTQAIANKKGCDLKQAEEIKKTQAQALLGLKKEGLPGALKPSVAKTIGLPKRAAPKPLPETKPTLIEEELLKVPKPPAIAKPVIPPVGAPVPPKPLGVPKPVPPAIKPIVAPGVTEPVKPKIAEAKPVVPKPPLPPKLDNLKSYTDLLKDKKEDDVPSGEETPIVDKDYDKGEISGFIMPVIDRLILEIRRSLDYYATQSQGTEINQIYLTGGSALLKNIDKLLSERLGVEVSLFNPVQDIEAPEIESPFGFSAALGLSMRGIFETPVSYNLIPKDIFIREQIANFKKNIITASIFAFLIIVEIITGLYMHYTKTAKFKDFLQNEIKGYIIDLKTRKPLQIDDKPITYKDVVETVNKLEKENQELQKRFNAIEKLQSGKVKWLDVMLYVKRFIPQDIRLLSITFSSKNRLQMRLMAPSYPKMSEFYKKVTEETFFPMTDIEKQQKLPNGTKTPDGIEFSLDLTFDQSKIVLTEIMKKE